MTAAEIDDLIQAHRAEVAELTANKELLEDRLFAARVDLDLLRARAVRFDESESDFQIKADEVASGERLIIGYDVEISQLANKIERLQASRVEAVQVEAYAEFEALTKVGQSQADKIEKSLSAFAGTLQDHRDTMIELSRLAKAAGIPQVQLDCRHVFRRSGQKWHEVSPYTCPRQLNAEYQRPYGQIFKHLIKNIESQNQIPDEPERKAV